jgi:pyruvate/2-oxoglutarate dehydrogenase complex dihydrolipoamide dehydrogenase (E3) component
MTRVLRAVEKGETNGFMKILVDGDSKQILGAAILGTGGDEVAYLENLKQSTDALNSLLAQTTVELDALMPSILDKAFRREL